MVYIDGWEVGRTVAEGGFFALTLNQPLAMGPHQVQASTASGGLLSERSAPQWFTVSTTDASPPGSTAIGSEPTTLSQSFSLKIGGSGYNPPSILITSQDSPAFSGGCSCNNNESGSGIISIVSPARSFPITCRADSTWQVSPGTLLIGPSKVAQIQFSVQFFCINNNNNNSTTVYAKSGDFFIDQFPPDTRIKTPPSKSSVKLNEVLTIGFEATDSPVESEGFGFGYECSVNGSGWSTTGCLPMCSIVGVGRYDCATATPGNHTLLVRAKDEAGNVDPTPAAYVWNVDNMAPASPVITGIEPSYGGYAKSKKPIIRGTAQSPGDRVKVTLVDGIFSFQAQAVVNDQNEWQVSVPANPLEQLEEGKSYTVRATASDVAGNESPPSGAVGFTVDSVPPQTQIVSGRLPKPSQSKSISIQVSATDTPGSGVARFECGFNGIFNNCLNGAGGNLTTNAPGDGLYALQVRAVDTAGNVDPTPELWILEVDTVVPDTLITNNPPKATYEEQAIFEFSAQDSDIHIEYECEYVSPNGTTTVGECGTPYIFKGLIQGLHVLRVTAIDRAGNRDPKPAEWEWFVDKGVPQANIISPKEDFLVTNQTSTQIIFGQATDAGVVSYECRVGTTTQFEPCNSPKDIERGDGEHIFQVRAVNDGGIRTPENLYDSFRWVVDTIEPETIIANGPEEGVWLNADTVSFTVAAVDSNLEGFQCSLNDETFRECPAQVSEGGSTIAFPYANLDDGNYTLQVRAVDKAKNVDESSARRSWVVDTQAPAPPEFSAMDGEVLVFTSRPVLEGSAEPDTRVLILLRDQSEPAAIAVTGSDGTWRAQIDQSLASDDYDIKGYAVDRAGNRSTDAQVKLVVDNRAPAMVQGGGLGCTSFPGEVSILALAGGLGLMRRRQRGRDQSAQQ
ncbi:Ig-like domain-containing protein [Archangium sp.]|uniref:Ig-like domain-containing protein n=1 Tax=Archangium sp. TaxID=1872627 RepID=UPI002D6C672C|nr:Ig-like domain-containing protein [Archangium sp.]HYO56490.1 Ig-like domain-containing protein [Archangium sp.]